MTVPLNEHVLKMQYLKKEVNDKVYFWHADKHRSFLQGNTIILDLRS